MPVYHKMVGATDVSRHSALINALVDELTAPRAFGQPLVTEEEFPRTNRLGVTVVWDRFDRVQDLARPAIIRQAYDRAQPDKANRIAFANGYTIPEADEVELLPYLVGLVRSDKPPTAALVERCHVAMTELGASVLADPAKPMLRFPTSDQAVACLGELVRRVPESAGMWAIYEEGRAMR